MRIFFLCVLLAVPPAMAGQSPCFGGDVKDLRNQRALVPRLYPGLIALVGAFGQRIFLQEQLVRNLFGWGLRRALPVDVVRAIAEYLQEVAIGTIRHNPSHHTTDETAYFLPHNVVVTQDGGLVAIDRNWLVLFPGEANFGVRIGTPGQASGQFIGPSAVTVDPHGNIVVADTLNDRIQVLTREGAFIREIGNLGRGGTPRLLHRPEGVAVTQDGVIVVADTFSDRLVLFQEDGICMRVLGHVGGEPGQFSRPRGLAITSDGNIVVADTGNNRLQLLTQDGIVIRTIGSGPGSGFNQFNYPVDVAIIRMRAIIIIADTYNERLQLVREDGTFVGIIRTTLGRLYGVAIDPFGIIIVANGDRLVLFNYDAFRVQDQAARFPNSPLR